MTNLVLTYMELPRRAGQAHLERHMRQSSAGCVDSLVLSGLEIVEVDRVHLMRDIEGFPLAQGLCMHNPWRNGC